jgi:hypothetical protein
MSLSWNSFPKTCIFPRGDDSEGKENIYTSNWRLPSVAFRLPCTVKQPLSHAHQTQRTCLTIPFLKQNSFLAWPPAVPRQGQPGSCNRPSASLCCDRSRKLKNHDQSPAVMHPQLRPLGDRDWASPLPAECFSLVSAMLGDACCRTKNGISGERRTCRLILE